MIKQYILSIEADDELIIDQFIELLNKQAEGLKNVSPIKIMVEKK